MVNYISKTRTLKDARRAIFEVFGPEVKHDKFISFKEYNNNDIENTWRIKHWFPRFRNLDSARIHTRHVATEFNEEKDSFWRRFIIRLWQVIHIPWNDYIYR